MSLHAPDFIDVNAGAVDESGGLMFTPVPLDDDGLAGGTRVETLAPGTRYLFRVLAVNAEGSSGWSEIGAASTAAAPPGAPGAPRLTSAASAASLQLAWDAAQPCGAPVTGYTLAMAACDAARSPPAPATPPQGGSPAAVRPVAGAAAHVLAPGSGTGAPDAGAGRGRGGGGAADGVAAEGRQDGLCAEAPAEGRLEPERAALATVYSGTALCAEVRGLDAYTLYLLRVRATNAAGVGQWSALAQIATAPAPPSQPLGLVAAAASSSSMFVAWKCPAMCRGAPVLGYTVEYAEAKAASGVALRSSKQAPAWRHAYTGDILSCMVGDLRPGRLYRFRVRATNVRGPGAWSSEVAAETAPAPPDAPTDVATSQRTASSLRVKWAPPAEENGAAVLRYRVEVSEDGGENAGKWRHAWSGAAGPARVDGLAPARQYCVRVGAANAVGEGPWSAVASASTLRLPPAAPLNISVESCSGPALLVRWLVADHALHVDAATHEVEVREAAGGGGAQAGRHTAPGRARELTIGGLLPGTTYQVRVRSVGMEGAGHSAWSATATAALPGPRAAPARDAKVTSAAAAAALAPSAPAAPAKRRASREPAGSPAGSVGRAAKRPEKRGAAVRVVAAKKPPWRLTWRQARLLAGRAVRYASGIVVVAFFIFVMVYGASAS